MVRLSRVQMRIRCQPSSHERTSVGLSAMQQVKTIIIRFFRAALLLLLQAGGKRVHSGIETLIKQLLRAQIICPSLASRLRSKLWRPTSLSSPWLASCSRTLSSLTMITTAESLRTSGASIRNNSSKTKNPCLHPN